VLWPIPKAVCWSIAHESSPNKSANFSANYNFVFESVKVVYKLYFTTFINEC